MKQFKTYFAGQSAAFKLLFTAVMLSLAFSIIVAITGILQNL